MPNDSVYSTGEECWSRWCAREVREGLYSWAGGKEWTYIMCIAGSQNWLFQSLCLQVGKIPLPDKSKGVKRERREGKVKKNKEEGSASKKLKESE